mmetsp:Transcript_15373/g.23572  ORF Transcript_15373/g.23572 Transcript_15373/m.23572 type:complete len:530 (-) Transcript_15373:186-1775(-)
MIPSIDPSDVGTTGLLWLVLSYGYVLFFASNLISEGSDLLLLVPSMAGLVGSVILPLLGAVPDGAIMLFSGLGDNAQETLSVGVGALAGSTIMLLTISWGLSIFGGRVDIINNRANYGGKPRLTPGQSWSQSGVALDPAVSHGGIIMMVTTLPFFLIQGPAFFVDDEKYWALAGLVLCIIGFSTYLILQFRMSKLGEDKGRRLAVVKKLLLDGKVSLRGALAPAVKQFSQETIVGGRDDGYQGIDNDNSEAVKTYFKEVLREPFRKYDINGDGTLDAKEVRTFFNDFHESITEEGTRKLFQRYDTDGDGTICYDEFIDACFTFITNPETLQSETDDQQQVIASDVANDNDDDDEAEEVPEDFFDLEPEQQQKAIKFRAFSMLFVGTALVLLFADPMVDVLQEIATRIGMSPFYVSFLLAPLASNASEVIASQYYSRKKTRKTITVALTALEGAAAMNNTFCLSIFMGLIYFRGLIWQYSAETMAILGVQFVLGFWVQKRIMRATEAMVIVMVFPLSLVFVAGMESLGFD